MHFPRQIPNLTASECAKSLPPQQLCVDAQALRDDDTARPRRLCVCAYSLTARCCGRGGGGVVAPPWSARHRPRGGSHTRLVRAPPPPPRAGVSPAKMARAVTAFEQRVYDALCRVPAGRVTTYKARGGGRLWVPQWPPRWRQVLAEALACGSSQAVGQALKRNPFAPVRVVHAPSPLPGGWQAGACGRQSVLGARAQRVPCHRVIASDHSIGGFCGATARADPQIVRKLALLAGEGDGGVWRGSVRVCVVPCSQQRCLYGALQPRVSRLMSGITSRMRGRCAQSCDPEVRDGAQRLCARGSV